MDMAKYSMIVERGSVWVEKWVPLISIWSMQATVPGSAPHLRRVDEDNVRGMGLDHGPGIVLRGGSGQIDRQIGAAPEDPLGGQQARAVIAAQLVTDADHRDTGRAGQAGLEFFQQIRQYLHEIPSSQPTPQPSWNAIKRV